MASAALQAFTDGIELPQNLRQLVETASNFAEESIPIGDSPFTIPKQPSSSGSNDSHHPHITHSSYRPSTLSIDSPMPQQSASSSAANAQGFLGEKDTVWDDEQCRSEVRVYVAVNLLAYVEWSVHKGLNKASLILWALSYHVCVCVCVWTC